VPRRRARTASPSAGADGGRSGGRTGGAGSGGEARPALGAARLDHPTPTGSGHSRPETVPALALDVAGLERSLHHATPRRRVVVEPDRCSAPRRRRGCYSRPDCSVNRKRDASPRGRCVGCTLRGVYTRPPVAGWSDDGEAKRGGAKHLGKMPRPARSGADRAAVQHLDPPAAGGRAAGRAAAVRAEPVRARLGQRASRHPPR